MPTTNPNTPALTEAVQSILTGEDVVRLRASEMPLATVCRPAPRLRKTYTTSGDAESVGAGRAVHYVVERRVKSQDVTAQDLRLRFGLTAETAQEVFNRAEFLEFDKKAALVSEVDLAMDLLFHPVPRFLTEKVDNPAAIYSGRLDLMQVNKIAEGTAGIRIWDIKSGAEGEYYAQLLMQCVLALVNYPEASVAKASCLFLANAEKTVEVTVERHQLGELCNQLAQIRMDCKTSEDYVTGNHCAYCVPGKCPAWESAMGQLWRGTGLGAGESLTIPEQLQIVLPRLKTAKSLLEKMETMAKEYVKQNGPIVFPNGTQYEARNYTEETIDGERGLEVLHTLFPSSVVGKAMGRITKTTLEKIPDADIEQILARLRSEGALRTESRVRVGFYKQPKNQP